MALSSSADAVILEMGYSIEIIRKPAMHDGLANARAQMDSATPGGMVAVPSTHQSRPIFPLTSSC